MQPPSPNSTISVVIADDHEIIRDAVRGLLEQAGEHFGHRFEVVASAADGLSAIAQVKAHRPELLFLDISMPMASGVEIIHDVRRWSPDTRILVFTGITSPYEEPQSPELVVETDLQSTEEIVAQILEDLVRRGIVAVE